MSELTQKQAAALAEYEAAVVAGHAPVGSTAVELKRRGSAVQVAAAKIQKTEKGLSNGAARDRVRRAVAQSGAVVAVNEESEPDMYELGKVEIQRRRIVRLQTDLRNISVELEEARKIREHAFGLAPQAVRASKWNAVGRSPSGKRETPILFTSDFQAGEVIKAEDMRGENEYNLEIFRKRYRTMIGVAINLIEKHHGGADQIVYLRGGDAISGGIHDELKDTDDVPPPMQAIAVIEEETAGIRHLANKFGKVIVISIAGNHDRTTHKPRGKEYMQHSYDLLMQYGIEAQFKNDPRVEFITDMSGDVLFDVHGYKMLLTHGDRMGTGGGQGFLGTVGPVMRGAKKVKAAYAAEGHHVDLVLCGHYHTPMHISDVVLCNGSTAGHSEYARTRIRAEPHPPSQTLFFVHEERGVTATRLIDVNNRPTKSKGARKVV